MKPHILSGHAQYRTWCIHCVRGRGHDRQHRGVKDKEEEEVTNISMDYGYLTGKREDREEAEGHKDLPMIVMVDRKTKLKEAILVNKKG